ncbi:hypothetical protein PPERSA_08677 [Pseudocohnilembus persalinus]|uniref:Uncharacterized protein n=1 Tax=Pseudocohnilembus persalinus TaxID=266149 RepID=A0A0V0R8P6_PSEPJ|nr:hypothetical protein PPERSA_08677 [Pseudocohnilembus persalinus]|eukprot:KRX10682.1 hypothetical protein PPERSA_08677 [Pseudocohnilembus persalinus]
MNQSKLQNEDNYSNNCQLEKNTKEILDTEEQFSLQNDSNINSIKNLLEQTRQGSKFGTANKTRSSTQHVSNQLQSEKNMKKNVNIMSDTKSNKSQLDVNFDIPIKQNLIQKLRQSQEEGSADKKEEKVNKIVDFIKGGEKGKDSSFYKDKFLFDFLSVEKKKFYQNKKEFLNIMTEYDITNACFQEIIKKIKCYRYELGSFMERISNQFLLVAEKFLDAGMDAQEKNQKKFKNSTQKYLDQIQQLENEKKQLENVQRSLNGEKSILKTNQEIDQKIIEGLQEEVKMLKQVLKKDLSSMISQVGQIEQQSVIKNNTYQNDYSDKMVSGLSRLNHQIKQIEDQHSEKQNQMQNMNNLIKAMVKSSKQDIGTQVDEFDLTWNTKQVIIGDPKKNYLSLQEMEALSIGLEDKLNVANLLQQPTNQEILNLKEKELNINKKNTYVKNSQNQQNWNLPVSLIVFLENVSKTNDTGKVIPWGEFKKQINSVYQFYLENQWEVHGSLQTSAIYFDEVLILYFISQYSLRRTAEIKLFEFLISLRYYYPSHLRAKHFALMCNIAQLQVPAGEPPQIYKFDIYLQSYFFFVFQTVNEQSNFFFEKDGNTYLSKPAIKKITSEINCVFNDHIQVQIQQKIDRSYQKINNSEQFDVDKFIEIYIEEYLEIKKKNNKLLAKIFSKQKHGHAYEQQNQEENEFFSIQDILRVIKYTVPDKSPLKNRSFPKQLTLLRVYLHSITMGRNKFDINSKEFMNSVSKFGLDSPFPNIRTSLQTQNLLENLNKLGKKTNKNKIDQNHSQIDNAQKSAVIQNLTKQEVLNMLSGFDDLEKEDLTPILQILDKDYEQNQENENNNNNSNFKIDAASTLFAQHFSILRELRMYCKSFKENIGKEENPDVLWNEFNNIMSILDSGCQFLNFPITM